MARISDLSAESPAGHRSRLKAGNVAAYVTGSFVRSMSSLDFVEDESATVVRLGDIQGSDRVDR